MHIFSYIWKEIRFRRFNFWAGVFSVCLAMAVWSAAPVMLRAQRRQTVTMLEEREREMRKEMRKMEDDYRIIMRDMGHNVMILPKDEDLAELQRTGIPKYTMPQDYADRLGTIGDVKSLNHILPVLQRKIIWPEHNAEIILSGTSGQIPTPHRKRHLTADGKAYKSPIMPTVPNGQVFLGSAIAAQLNLKEGMKVRLLDDEFIVGKVRPSEGGRADISVWCDLSWMQEKLSLQGQISLILALECLCNIDGVGGIVKEIRQWIPEVQVEEFSSMVKARALARRRASQTHKQAMEEFKEQRENIFNLQKRLASILRPAVVVFSGLWIFFLFWGNVRERRQEMGVLRSVGVSEVTLLQLFLIKSLVMGLIGALFGFFIGHTLAVNGIELVWWSEHWKELLRWNELLTVVIAAPALSIIAAWAPAMRASRTDPAIMLMEN